MAKKEIIQHFSEIAHEISDYFLVLKKHMKINICCDNRYTWIMKSAPFARQKAKQTRKAGLSTEGAFYYSVMQK